MAACENIFPWGDCARQNAAVSIFLAISLSDIMRRRVRNELVGMTLLLALFSSLAGSNSLTSVWQNISALCIGASIMLIPYAFGKVGAADVKVLAAYACLVGFQKLGLLLLYSTISAGFLGFFALWYEHKGSVGLMTMALMHPRWALKDARVRGTTIPLTVALSLGAASALFGGTR